MRSDLFVRLYALAVRALPEPFRMRYGDDMEAVFAERLSEGDAISDAIRITMSECSNVLVAGVRMRVTDQQPLQAPALIALFILLSLVRTPDSFTPATFANTPVDSVDFRATDPAGQFTLHVRYGRAVAGSVDNHRVSRRQLIQTEDSIRVLNPRGRVLFAVAYNRDEATIRWSPRPVACKGRALSCGVEQ